MFGSSFFLFFNALKKVFQVTFEAKSHLKGGGCQMVSQQGSICSLGMDSEPCELSTPSAYYMFVF